LKNEFSPTVVLFLRNHDKIKIKSKTEEQMTTKKKIGIFALLFLLIAFSGFVAWANNAMAAQAMAIDAMKGTQTVRVDQDHLMIVFTPLGQIHQGLIFYPGAKVDPQAYAPLAAELAKEEILTVIVPMPLNLAILGSNKALAVMEKYPEVSRWAISGHSLGGAMACKFVSDHPGKVESLILLGAYTTSNWDLSLANLSVLSVSASNDGLSTPEKVDKNREFLPSDTVFFEIEGGNHAQFGDYGEQIGDGKAEISGSEQLDITVTQILTFLEG